MRNKVETDNVSQDTSQTGLPHNFNCCICHQHFRSSKELETHFRKSISCSGYVLCDVCKLGYNGELGLKRHHLKSSCGDSSSSKRKETQENQSVAEVKSSKEFRCECCSKEDSTKRPLDLHWKQKPSCCPYEIECSVCLLKFENRSNLKRHLTMTGCGAVANKDSLDCTSTVTVDGNPDLLTGQVQHHSALSQNIDESELKLLQNQELLNDIQWPAMNCEKAWRDFDLKVSKQIHPTGTTNQRIHMLEMVIYNEAVATFGITEKKSPKKKGCDRRIRKLTEVRKQIKSLASQIKECPDGDMKDGLIFLLDDKKKERRVLRQRELKRKRRWRQKCTRQKFYENPYSTAKSILSSKESVPLKVSKEVLDQYVESVTKDPLRNVDLPPLPGLPDCPQPEVPFESRSFKLNDLKNILKKTKNASKPGVNKIPYKVYKKCENLAKCLFLIIKCVQNSNYVPLKWRISDGVMIPKVDRPKKSD